MKRKKRMRIAILCVVGIVVLLGFSSNGYANSEAEKRVDELITRMRQGKGLWPGDTLASIGIPAVAPLISEYRLALRESKGGNRAGLPNLKPRYRTKIIAILGKIGTDKAMKLLFEAATNKNEMESVRIFAVRNLGKKRNSFTEKGLLTILKSEEKRIAEYALEGLEALAKKDSEIAMKAIFDSIRDQRRSIRYRAIRALFELDKPASTKKLLELFKDPDSDYSKNTIAAALSRRKTGQAVDGLALIVKSDTSKLSRQAAVALGRNLLPNAAVELRNIFNDDNNSQYVRECALVGLGEVMRTGKDREDSTVTYDIMDEILDLMKNKDAPPGLRWGAMDAVKKYFRSTRDVPLQPIHTLISQLDDENRRLKKDTFGLLADIVRNRAGQSPDFYHALEAPPCMDQLILALKEGEVAVKNAARKILIGICKNDPDGAGRAVAGLIDNVLKNRDSRTRRTQYEDVMRALEKVATPAAVKGIAWAIDNKRGARVGCWALGQIGPNYIDPDSIVTLLARALEDTDYMIRREAVISLGNIGTARAVRLLKKARNDRHTQVRRFAENALIKIRATNR
ncbi:MAG: HEAT repeat domain-containing protein [bacterium]|nr:HEAT repeat domain-containing protein [bacterium]